MNSTIINKIPNMQSKTYLELGIGNGASFESVKAKKKTSVDIKSPADFNGTTDEFFASLRKNRKFDVIFIDANHDFDFAVRDFNNAVKFCREWVLIHDMIPPSGRYIRPRFCSDSYRLLHYLLKYTDYTVLPMQGYFGLTFVKMPVEPLEIEPARAQVGYPEFAEFIAKQRLYTEDEIAEALCAS